MSKYGLTAVIAARHAATSGADPLEAWKTAAAEIITKSKAVREKGCPRGAFLGNYTRSRLNKTYALKAYSLLKHDSDLAGDITKLWSLVVGPKPVGQNGQADVVVELWNNDLLQRA